MSLTLAQHRALDARRRVLERGLLAAYEIIDGIRQEMAEIDAKLREAGTPPGNIPPSPKPPAR